MRLMGLWYTPSINKSIVFQDGVIVENMHDVPYVQSDSVGPEVTAMMTAICVEVKRLLKPSPVGIQVLAGANKQAMAVAKAAGG